MRGIPIAVFPRPGSTNLLTHCKPAQSCAAARLPARAAPILALANPPAWLFLPVREDSVSSTLIRAQTPW
jgi:nicotinate-nucleotide adenylyltransferase